MTAAATHAFVGLLKIIKFKTFFMTTDTYKVGAKTSTAFGVQTPLKIRSNILRKAAPFPDNNRRISFRIKDTISLTFDRSNNSHDNVPVRINFSCMSNTIMDFLASNNFFHASKNYFTWHELCNLVKYVKRRVEHEIPKPDN